MKNSAGRGECYPPRPSTSVDNTLRDLQNSSYPTKAEFNNCFIIHSKYYHVQINNIPEQSHVIIIIINKQGQMISRIRVLIKQAK